MQSVNWIIRRSLVLALTICSLSYLTGCCDQLMPKAKPADPADKMANQMAEGKTGTDDNKPLDAPTAPSDFATNTTSAVATVTNTDSTLATVASSEADTTTSAVPEVIETTVENTGKTGEPEQIDRIDTEELD